MELKECRSSSSNSGLRVAQWWWLAYIEVDGAKCRCCEKNNDITI
jgi:hypothetical protein